jgi:hypothetical protein
MNIDFRESRVLFFAPYGLWIVHEQINAVLAKAMQLRGAAVLSIVCDGLYHDHCYPLVNSKPGGKVRDCQACARNSESLFTSFNIPYQQIRSHVTQEIRERAESWISTIDPTRYHLALYNDLRFGEWVFPTVCSYLKISSPSFSDPKLQEVLRQYLYYSFITYFALEKIIEDFQPTNLVMYSGVGMVHTAVAELAIRKGIRLLCHTLGRERGAFLYTENDPVSAFKPRFYINDIWKDTPLLKDEAEQVSNYLNERRQGVNHNMPTFYRNGASECSVGEYLNIPNGKKIFGVFTSSEYERVYFPEYKHLPSQIEVLESLISIFEQREDYLVIRHHPLIGGGDIDRPDGDFLARSYELARRVPRNVRFLMPHEPLTSYALMWELDASFAPFTTTALEAIAAGVPTLAYQGSPYAPGVTFLLNSFDRESLLRGINIVLQDSAHVERTQLSTLYRFMYSFVYRQSMAIKACKSNGMNSLQIEINSFDDLLPGNDPVLDHLCGHIASESVGLYETPSKERKLIDCFEENSVLDQNLEMIRTKRNTSRINVRPIGATKQDDSLAHVRMIQENIGISPYGGEFQYIEREDAVVPYICTTPQLNDYRRSLLSLQNVLRKVQQEFVLVGQEFIQYDASIFSLSLKYYNNKPETSSVWWGGWVQEITGIREGLFTKVYPVSNYSDLCQRFSQFLSPLLLMAFTVWKKAALESIIIRLLDKSNVTDMCIEILQVTAQQSNINTEIPLLVIHAELFEESITNKRLSSSTALHII